MVREIHLPEHFMGFDATIRVEFEITDWGTPEIVDYVYGHEPASGPDWDVSEIGLTIHTEDGDGPEWMIDPLDRQFRLIANSGDLVNAILEEIAEERECRPYKRSYRAWRAAE